MQQQGQVQAMKAYKAAVCLSSERIQQLQDRYFNSTPTGAFSSGKQSGSGALKLQREGIVPAYTDYQQRRGSIASMHIVPAAGTCSPTSSLRRGTWTGSSQGSMQQPLQHLPSHVDSPARNLNSSSRFMVSRHSFAAPVSRTSSSAASHKQGCPDQPFAARTNAGSVSPNTSFLLQQTGSIKLAGSALPAGEGYPEQPSSAAPNMLTAGASAYADGVQFLQLDNALTSLHSQQLAHAGTALSDTDVHVMTNWNIPEVQPEPSWSTSFSEQVLQLEGCLLTALTGLLTQGPGPASSDEHDKQRAEAKRKGQNALPRQQVWPKAAEASQQSAEDTTGTAFP